MNRDTTLCRVTATEGDELVRERAAVAYTPAEQEFSQYIQDKMHRLLRGADDRFVLMRRYQAPRCQIGFFMPGRIPKREIRPDVAENIVFGVLRFLDPFAPGGPICQEVDSNRLTETQTFPTQFPHIVVERTDVFTAATRRCLYVEWRAVRLQNQRRSTAVNRALDLGNLAFELARFVRPV